MELHCNGKNLKSSISQFFLDQIDFFYKTDYLSLALLYMWVKYELMWLGFSPQNEKIQFSEKFPIVIPIVIQKRGAMPQNSSFKLFLGGFWSIL